MRFTSFRIENFKGIQSCTIQLDRPNPGVYTLIGLNESGKTTILEAINYFIAADESLQKIYHLEEKSIDKAKFVPKSRKLNFNDKITIAAKVLLEPDDIDALAKVFLENGYLLDRSQVPKVPIEVTQNFQFENSDYVRSNRTWDIAFYAQKKNGTKINAVNAKHECWKLYHETLKGRLPQICYFPTFLSDLPDRIYLDNIQNETDANAYYRQLLQDILDSLGDGLTIQKHIIDRIRSSEGSWSWFSFLQTDRREQVNHVLLKASTQVSTVIIDSWKRVFNKKLENKRIELEYGHDQNIDSIYVKFYMVDGSEKYEIENRSLGFRWFFCFWLFTHFRRLRSETSSVVFLLDEPASNLHARAQEELLVNIKTLAEPNNVVIYSTHSHYLINPRWLDAAYIISNGESADGGVGEEFKHGGPTNIKATKYKQFVGKHPNQRNYFLPVLDALDYKPSELTIERPALLVEGKADFAFLSVAWAKKERSFSIVPGNGAKSLDPLIGLMTGWGFSYAILLDDDKEGREAKVKYELAWGLSSLEIFTLKTFDDQFGGKSLEDILLEQIGPSVAAYYGSEKAEKIMVQTYFYEKMAANETVSLHDSLQKFADELYKKSAAILTTAA